jgi:predicted ATPase/DNA-binding XRE family transcriptional regulator
VGNRERGGFGNLLRRYRIAAGLTQQELAERAGLSARGVQDLERGIRRSPHPDTTRRLAEALGLRDAERGELLRAVDGVVVGSSSGGPLVARLATAPLPMPLTSFVGRQAELAEIQRLLSATRLLTLTGVGGIGKTRLALEAARRLADDYQDGTGLVELAGLVDPGLVPQAVANVVGAREQPGRAVQDSLVESLRQRQLLLVLDNCEHVVQACAALAEQLLRNCPDVRILATSRSRLGLESEQLWPVPPLGLADARSDAAAASEAVRLFVDRVQLVQPDFTTDDRNIGLVLEICRRLDGIPLAIELAAARMRVLGLEQLAARLNQRLSLLTSGNRTAPPRQQTLRATLDWSYALLDLATQQLFDRLSVFAGGWDLDAAVALATDGELDAAAILDLLSRLVDHSMLAVESAASRVATRYGLPETLREYGRERLKARGEDAPVRAPRPLLHPPGRADRAGAAKACPAAVVGPPGYGTR